MIKDAIGPATVYFIVVREVKYLITAFEKKTCREQHADSKLKAPVPSNIKKSNKIS